MHRDRQRENEIQRETDIQTEAERNRQRDRDREGRGSENARERERREGERIWWRELERGIQIQRHADRNSIYPCGCVCLCAPDVETDASIARDTY